MWPVEFSTRLAAWNQLRITCATSPVPDTLALINNWWYQVPWRPYYLHWDDMHDWPDPWQLLSDNAFCDVARGLGILYTLSMLDRTDIPPAKLVLTKGDDNLVLVGNEKYILNWDREKIVDTTIEVTISRELLQRDVQNKYK